MEAVKQAVKHTFRYGLPRDVAATPYTHINNHQSFTQNQRHYHKNGEVEWEVRTSV